MIIVSNIKTFLKKTPLLKEYLILFLVTGLSLLMIGIYTFITTSNQTKDNDEILKKEARNIEYITSEAFDYTNQISSYIAKLISTHGSEDNEFISNLLHNANVTENSRPSSWVFFDWENSKNLQISGPAFNANNIWVIPTKTNVVDKNGIFLGNIIANFNIDEFINRLKRLNEKVSFVILDENLNIIMQSSDNAIAKNDSFYKKNITNEMFNFPPAGKLKNDIEIGDIRYSFYNKMENYPYTILTGLSKTYLDKEFNRLILPRILEFIGVTIFFLIVLYIYDSRIIHLLDVENKLRKSLLQTNVNKAKLVRAVGHDLKNYVFGISELVKLILENKTSAQIEKNKDLKLIESISNQSDELAYFVEDLLDTNQNNNDEFNLGKMEECSIKDLINRMLILNKHLYIKHQIKIEANIDDNIPRFLCDPKRIKQIFTGLIANAVKYSPADTTVRIAVGYLVKNRQIYIEILDQGIGMDEKEIQIALGEVEKKDKENVDSNEITMPQIKKLAELHKGKLIIDSKKGVGTKVRLYFDLPEKLPDQIITVQKSINPKNKSILLAEDNPVSIKITTAILKKAGYNVKYVENGKEALNILDKEHFDLILMDGQMPVMDGYEAAKAIRSGKYFKKFKNYKTIPIIALTAKSYDEIINQVKDSGMDAHIDKSSSIKDWLDLIVNYLDKNK